MGKFNFYSNFTSRVKVRIGKKKKPEAETSSSKDGEVIKGDDDADGAKQICVICVQYQISMSYFR